MYVRRDRHNFQALLYHLFYRDTLCQIRKGTDTRVEILILHWSWRQAWEINGEFVNVRRIVGNFIRTKDKSFYGHGVR